LKQTAVFLLTVNEKGKYYMAQRLADLDLPRRALGLGDGAELADEELNGAVATADKGVDLVVIVKGHDNGASLVEVLGLAERLEDLDAAGVILLVGLVIDRDRHLLRVELGVRQADFLGLLEEAALMIAGDEVLDELGALGRHCAAG